MRSAESFPLTFLLLLSALLAVSAVAWPDEARRRLPQASVHPNLAGQTLKVARDELVNSQLRPLTCIYRTLASRSANADLVFIASPEILEPANDGKKSGVLVERVLKSTEKVTLKPGDTVYVPEPYLPQNSLVVLVFCQEDGERGMAITEGEPISREMADHLAMLSTFSDPLARFEYLLHQEQNPDSSIAMNVFCELTSTSEETLNLIANGIPKQRVINGVPVLGTSIGSRKLTDRDVFYIKLLGIVGDAEDVHYLEPLVFGPQPGAPDLYLLHSEATRSYLKLAGATGGEKLIDAVTTQRLQHAAAEGEVKPAWPGIYHVYMATKSLRHRGEFEPIYQATSKLMLDETPYADVVLHTETSERDPRWIDDAIRIYGRSKEDYVRAAILAYVIVIRRDCVDELSSVQHNAVKSFLAEMERDHPREIAKANRAVGFLWRPAAER